MDLRSDEYSMLVGDKARRLASLLAYTPQGIHRAIAVDPAQQSGGRASDMELISELLHNHLLTTVDDTAPPIRADIPLPEDDLLSAQYSVPHSIGIRDAARFFAACLVATWRLRHTRVEEIVGAVERRKLLRALSHPVELSQARRLVRTFSRLRPLFPRNFLCLFDSLALLEFLARYDCYPTWVFAVKFDPWAAHCWVQEGPITFDEDAAEARNYCPVMTI